MSHNPDKPSTEFAKELDQLISDISLTFGKPRRFSRIPEILSALGHIWQDKPNADMRLSQLLWTIINPPDNDHGYFYNFEDEKLLKRLRYVLDHDGRWPTKKVPDFNIPVIDWDQADNG